MKKLLFLLLLYFHCYHSQNKSFIFELNYRPDSKKDSLISKRMILDIKDNESVFRTEDDKKSDSLIATSKFGIGADQHIERQLYIMKDKSSNRIIRSYRTRFNDYYAVKIEDDLMWKILSDKKKIGSFDVQKAELSYGGRNWIAWFTTQIPISDGPYVFHGLPGLIIKIADSDADYDFTLVEIKNPSESLFKRKKGLEMSFSDFKKLMIIYYNDPYADLKLRNMLPVYTSDGHGGKKALDLKELTERTQKLIRNHNNPIELNYRNDYK